MKVEKYRNLFFELNLKKIQMKPKESVAIVYKNIISFGICNFQYLVKVISNS